MSTRTDRADIAVTLSTVDGITGFAKAPDAPQAGDAWPLWRGMARENGTGLFVNAWDVLVVVPGDAVSASDFADDHSDALIGALSSLLFVTSCDPEKLASDQGDIFALRITGIRE